MTPLLFGLLAHDPATLIAASVALVGVATAAAWIPVARASQLDPATVLREQ